MKKLIVKTIALLILFSGCSVEDVVDGIDGIDGIDGQDGFSVGLVSVTQENGCKELTFFKDANSNGVLDTGESIIDSFTVCDGSDGQDGTSVSLFIEEASIEDCPTGGLLITVFTDNDADGEFDVDTESIITQTIACYPETSSIPKEGLLAYYSFNGNADDESGNDNHGTVNGAVLTTDRFGNLNSAYEFDEDSIVVENEFYNNGLEEYTINIWFLTNNPSKTFQCLFNTIPHNGESINYNHSSGRDSFTYWKGSDVTIAGWDVSNGIPFGNEVESDTWQMLTIVKKLNEYKVYLNNNLSLTVSETATVTNQLTGMRFGSTSLDEEFLNGKLDDIGIWNRALTESEITKLFNIE